ncbi:MAG TPA: hypothetical protein VKT77_23680 [Chthonomonadaceae bacterium]|nr:hypothetical protein [Chthonomonadaceae bacterium]
MIGEAAVPHLLPLLRSGAAPTRRMISDVLGTIGDADYQHS